MTATTLWILGSLLMFGVVLWAVLTLRRDNLASGRAADPNRRPILLASIILSTAIIIVSLTELLRR
jgi:hypothetical protein